MSKILKIIMIVILAVIVSHEAKSQTYYTSFEYSAAFNMGKASEYISEPGWAGFSIAIKKATRKNVTYGLVLGWNVFSKEATNATTQINNGAVYGSYAKYYNYYPILASVGYLFKRNRAKVIPYVQANLGAYYIYQKLKLGVYDINNDNWHFGFGPEIGLIFPVSREVGIVVNGKYNYALSSGQNLRGEDDNSYSFINANIGFVYMK